MSQAPSVTQPATTYAGLQNALGSLELDLEAELRRYRLHRSAEFPAQMNAQGLNGWQNLPEESVEVEAQFPDSQQEVYSYDSVSLPTPESPANRSPEVERVLERIRNPDATADPHGLLNLQDQQLPPEDYLDSSEELLRSVAGDPQSSQPQKRIFPLTPTRIALISAGVIGGALLLAIAVVNIFGKSPQPSPTAVNPVPAGNGTPEVAGSAKEPTTVNLASQEFLDLSLDNLSIVPPKEAPTVAQPAPTVNAPVATAQPTAPEAVVIPQPLAAPTGRENLAAALLPPSLRPQPVPAFPVTPQLAAKAPSNEVMVTPDGLKVGYYYVISRNTDPKHVGKVRELVKDAFVRNFPVGRAVQLSEVSSLSNAQALVQKFNNGQVATEIYHHQLSPASQR